jgi:hypothetical protein
VHQYLVLLCKQLMRRTVDYVCPVRKSIACNTSGNYKGINIPTVTPVYIGNKQIHKIWRFSFKPTASQLSTHHPSSITLKTPLPKER